MFGLVLRSAQKWQSKGNWEGGQMSISRDEESEDDSALDTTLDIAHIVTT